MIRLRPLRPALAAFLLAGAAAIALPAWATTTAPAEVAGRIVLPADVSPLSYAVAITPDLKALTFAGEATIEIDVRAPTRTVVLNSADLSFSRVSLSGVVAAPQASFDAEQQTATLTFPAEVLPGRHTLRIAYNGKINAHAAGLFYLDYDAPASVGGGRRRALFTQFENSDARRFLPCWDEPNKKASFQLSVAVPRDLMAVSNMPIASTSEVAGGLKHVTFGRTPKMSSYLLFFSLGDFERIHKDVDGIDVGVIVKRGATDQATYALDAAAHILPYYNEYFGYRYPLPKLDMIAGSGQSQFFGAMENWGAIFYFDRDVLIDPKLSTEADKQDVYIVVAHEMSHQWFGDLVTMDWWDDLWLNEGFASWMENKATDHFHPEWKLWLQAAASKQAAMALDARSGTHPVITPIRDVLQAEQAFDTITYEKGEAVIRMLEQYVGPDVWRDGVRRYIRAHAYGNTTTDDLWREMDAVSSRKITAIAHDFTLQPGVPLVTSLGQRCAGDRASGAVELARGRFAVDASDRGLAWRVPVHLHAFPDVLGGDASVVIDHPRQEEKIDCASAVIVNAGQAGYFRTLYTSDALAPLKAGYARLDPYDQLGVLNDASALGSAGQESYADTLDLTSAIPTEAEPIVARSLVERLVAVDSLLKGRPERVAWRAHARAVVAPLYAKLGWFKRSSESDNTAILRASVLSAMGTFDDPAVLAEAHSRFEAYRRGSVALDAGARETILGIVAAHADASTWEELHQLARTAATSTDKANAYFRLARALDPALAQRALALSLTDEPDKTTAPSMVTSVGFEHPAMALDFAIAHVDAINAVLEPDSRNSFIPRIAQESDDLSALAKLDGYAAAHIPATAQGEVVKARSSVRYSAQVKARVAPQVGAWLRAHPR